MYNAVERMNNDLQYNGGEIFQWTYTVPHPVGTVVKTVTDLHRLFAHGLK